MEKKPEIRVYAGPNGSGKSTFTELLGAFGEYINADEIKKQFSCSDLQAAQIAEQLREESVSAKIDFSFETVLSTDRNLNLLRHAKEQGYFIKVFYVLTKTPQINVGRIKSRVIGGGHPVPEEKIISRYHKALGLLPELIEICDVIHIYDNSVGFERIFKKRKDEVFIFETDVWSKFDIEKLVITN
ncbi:MAG: zeta toxin family protein [Lactobacillales bacterium]|jgi:predicted ABC-type ATPase|nr:zeta toxin family protein [Lactobacillales bacterium]